MATAKPMTNFWDSEVWSFLLITGILLLSLLVANMIKRSVKFLKYSLVPTSVLGGIILLLVSTVFEVTTGNVLFNTELFAGKGMAILEQITYHALALGFIASIFKSSGGKLSKQRTTEIVNTGVTTVSTYLIQGIAGLGITIIAALLMKNFFPAAGILLPFGYGQGTGQAMNYGNIYETDFGFVGGKSFGLTIAALGFLSASIGGVIHLNVLRKKNKIKLTYADDSTAKAENVEGDNEIPMQGSMDKLTVQLGFVLSAYLLTYVLMYVLGLFIPGMKATIYGFNFLLGVLAATLIKFVVDKCRVKKVINRQYINDFLMTRVSNFFFDIMVVAGIAAIRLTFLKDYWGILLILGIAGLFITFFYNKIVAKTLFKDYEQEQFLMMYGMLTGTASTGVILLREIDGEFRTPAADNMVYQNFPAIALGFPMMILATMAPAKPYLTLIILALYFVVLNVVLFRSKIFKKKKK
jgi:ESS family glutamate:Na+ symporter